MNKRIYLIILLLTYGSMSYSQTNVSGFININTTWDLAGSPYIVIGNVLISHGFTLTIDPGVFVKFDTDKAIQVDGELIAIGTPQNRITFTSNQVIPAVGDWAKIHFPDTCVNAILDVNGNYLSGSIMKYCDVLYGGGLGYGEIHVESSSPYFSHCNIMYSMNDGIYCHGASYVLDSSAVKNCDGYGLSFYTIQLTSCGLTVENDSIENNQSGGIYMANGNPVCSTLINNNYFDGNITQGAIFLNYHLDDMKITGNYFLNNTGPKIISALGNNLVVEKNLFFNNTCTMSVINLYGDNDTVKCNKFLGNQAGQHGVVQMFCRSSSIENNIFDGNINNATYGVSVTEVQGSTGTNTFNFSNNTVRNNSSPSGICCKFLVELYGSPLMNVNHNDFTNNIASEVVHITNAGSLTIGTNFLYFKYNNLSNPGSQYELYNDFSNSYPAIYVDSNYWGSINSQHIDSVIYDYFDDASKSIVYYLPFLSSAIYADTSCVPVITGINTTEPGFITTIFPNPATTHFTILFEKNINKGSIEIYNLLGKKMLRENIYHASKKEINIQSISNGIYLVKLFDGETYYCKKIIVEHN